MMRIFLLSMMGFACIMTFIGAIYFYRSNAKQNAIKDQLRDQGIIGYARVSDKSESSDRRINVSTNSLQTFNSYQLTLKYNINQRPSDDKNRWKDAFEGKKRKKLPKEYHEFTYNVGAKEYHNAEHYDKFPIIFLPDNPEAVQVLNDKGEMKSNSRYMSSVFLLAFSLLCLYLFLQYLITGKTI